MLKEDEVSVFLEHYGRHCAESGTGGDHHFLPIDPQVDLNGKFDYEALRRGLHERAWRRWFIATDGRQIVGHADLKGDALRSGSHRCELGIGVERSHRGRGLGRQLMMAAIDFARAADSIDWIDLRVFSHNTAAQRLYTSFGFCQVGCIADRFRIEDQKIDDLSMTLDVS